MRSSFLQEGKDLYRRAQKKYGKKAPERAQSNASIFAPDFDKTSRRSAHPWPQKTLNWREKKKGVIISQKTKKRDISQFTVRGDAEKGEVMRPKKGTPLP